MADHRVASDRANERSSKHAGRREQQASRRRSASAATGSADSAIDAVVRRVTDDLRQPIAESPAAPTSRILRRTGESADAGSPVPTPAVRIRRSTVGTPLIQREEHDKPEPTPPAKTDDGDKGDKSGASDSGKADTFDFAAAIRARRGQATGMPAEEVEAEATQEAEQRKAWDDFFGGFGKRATSEAQEHTADPMLNRERLSDVVSTHQKLGETGFGKLLDDKRARDATMKPPTPGSPLLHQHQEAKQARDAYFSEVGDLRTTGAERHAALTNLLSKAVADKEVADKAATWDKETLKAMEEAAAAAIAAVLSHNAPKLDPAKPTETGKAAEALEAAANTAAAKISALAERAKQDVAWMEMLRPYDEAKIIAGIALAETADDKSVMNNNMMISWRSITKGGAAADRDNTAIGAKVTSLANEIDRKTPFDPGEAKKKLTGGSPKERDELITMLQARTTVKRSITEIIKEKVDTPVLLTIVRQFDNVDGLGSLLGKTPTRADMVDIAKNAARDLEALRRVYDAAGGDPAKVKRWLCTDARHRIATIDRHTRRSGEAWCGATGAGPTLLPAGTTKENIEAVAVPREGSSWPAAGGYAGNRTYGNDHGPPDMLLPTLTETGAAITYKEYDIKPYQPGVNRGSQRFVKGSDGRYYYTADHYQTFTKFA